MPRHWIYATINSLRRPQVGCLTETLNPMPVFFNKTFISPAAYGVRFNEMPRTGLPTTLRKALQFCIEPFTLFTP
jgi:hypothetical protein